MSNTGATIKVANQIILRLFDHRQFTGGEITYHIKEFDKLNIDDNFNKTLQINQNACVIHHTSSKELDKLCDIAPAENILERLNSVVERTERLLSKEKESRIKEDQILEKERKVLQLKRVEVLDRTDIELNSLNESLIEEELELQRKFLRFEETLRKQPSQ